MNKFRKIIINILLLTSCFGMVACQNASNTNSPAADATATDEPAAQATPKPLGKVIVCFGDSITEGMGMARQDSYPSVLQASIKGDYTVLNSGVGGEGSFTIAARANAVEFTVTNEIVFREGVREIGLDWKLFSGMNGEEIKFRYGVMGRDLSTKNLTIDGNPYTMRFVNGDTEEDGKYFLGRADTGSDVTISVGSVVKFDYTNYFDKPHCIVALMGANDGSIGVDLLISRYKAIEATCEKFIALIPHHRKDCSEKFIEAFGDRCVDLREYCMEQVWVDYDFEKTAEDVIDLEAGRMPRSLLYKNNMGDCHLNEKGYKVLGDLVYKKGVELGYWE